jgi:hypothetical protein
VLPWCATGISKSYALPNLAHGDSSQFPELGVWTTLLPALKNLDHAALWVLSVSHPHRLEIVAKVFHAQVVHEVKRITGAGRSLRLTSRSG